MSRANVAASQHAIDAKLKDAKRRFRIDPRKSIKAGKNGSVLDVGCVAQAIGDSKYSGIRRDALEMFCHVLGDPAKASENPTSVVLAFKAMDGIRNMASAIIEDDALGQTLLEHWDKVVSWLKPLLESVTPQAPSSEQDSAWDLSYILRIATRSQHHSKKMLSRPGMAKTVAWMWLNEDQEHSLRHGAFPAEALQRLLIEIKPRTAVLDDLLVEASGNADLVINRALERVRTSRKKEHSPLALSHIATHFCLTTLLLYNPHAIREAFFDADKNGIKTLGKTALLFSRQKLANNPSNSAFSVLANYFESLCTVMETTVAKNTLRQAIDSGLLETIANCSPFLLLFPDPKEHPITIKYFLTDLIPIHLVYDSVIVAMSGALAKIKRSALEQTVDRSTLKDEWELMEFVLLDRWFWQRIIEHRLARAEIQKQCHNCRRSDSGWKPMKCSSCKQMTYCSTECQLISWKEKGHKQECKEMTERPEYAFLTRRDQKFMQLLVREDVCRHMPGLRCLAQKKYPGVPISRLGFSVSYFTRPPSLEVFDIEDATDPLTTGPGNRNLIANARREKRPDECLFRILLGNGIGKGVTVQMRCYPLPGGPKLDLSPQKRESAWTVHPKRFVARRFVMDGLPGEIMETQRDEVDAAIEALGIDKYTHWFSASNTDTEDTIDKRFSNWYNKVIARQPLAPADIGFVIVQPRTQQ